MLFTHDHQILSSSNYRETIRVQLKFFFLRDILRTLFIQFNHDWQTRVKNNIATITFNWWGDYRMDISSNQSSPRQNRKFTVGVAWDGSRGASGGNEIMDPPAFVQTVPCVTFLVSILVLSRVLYLFFPLFFSFLSFPFFFFSFSKNLHLVHQRDIVNKSTYRNAIRWKVFKIRVMLDGNCFLGVR